MQYYSYPAPKATYITPEDLGHIWVMRATEPVDPPPETIRIRSVWAYKPLSDGVCRIEPAALHSAEPYRVPFTFLGYRDQALWRQENMEFWVFNPPQRGELRLALKEHTAVSGGPTISVAMDYPIKRTLTLPVTQNNDAGDALAAVTAGTLVEAQGSRLLVLRIPGTGYSDLVCPE
jgi:hypothetical protein